MKHINMRNLEEIVDLVLAACVLHIVCLLSNEGDLDFYMNEENEEDVNGFENIFTNAQKGIKKRQHVMQNL